MIATIVDWNLLGKAVGYSVLFGLGILAVAGIAVASSLRAQDSRSGGNEAAFLGFSVVTVIGVAGIIAAIAGGIWVMTQ